MNFLREQLEVVNPLKLRLRVAVQGRRMVRRGGLGAILALLLCSVVLLYAQRKGASSNAQNRDQDSMSRLRKLEDDLRLAALKGDAGWWVDNLADGYSDTDFQGQLRDKAQTIELERSSALVYDAMNLTDRNVHTFNNDTAIITGKVSVEGTFRGQDLSGEFQFTRVWVKQGGDWKLASSQLTKIAP